MNNETATATAVFATEVENALTRAMGADPRPGSARSSSADLKELVVSRHGGSETSSVSEPPTPGRR